jgi:hypothetical protein
VDTVRDWRANEQLAELPRANIVSYFQRNQERLASTLRQLKNNRQGYIDLYRAAENVLAGQPDGLARVQLNYNMAGFSEAAYKTAEITGAFAQMAYEDVRRFAGLYDLQRKYTVADDAFLAIVGEPAASVKMTELEKMSRPELEELKKGLQRALASMNGREQLGALLGMAYAALLEDAGSADARENPAP